MCAPDCENGSPTQNFAEVRWTLLGSAVGDLQMQSAVHVALEAAGLRGGELSLSLGRHFSLRDLIKWARRMQVRTHRTESASLINL